jgi:type I site-specific restriction endonuclease
VDNEQRIRTLERDLGRLEGIVESLVTTVRVEYETARQARVDDRQAMNELGNRMEKVVENLAKEIREVATTTAKQSEELATQQAILANTASLSRWLFASVVAILTLTVSYAALTRVADHPIEPPAREKAKAPAVAPRAPLP